MEEVRCPEQLNGSKWNVTNWNITDWPVTEWNYTSCGTSAPVDVYYFNGWLQWSLLGALLAAITLGNTSVIIALRRAPAPRQARLNYFIMQLAIADLLVGVCVVLVDMAQKASIAWRAGVALCKIIKFLQGLAMYASTYVLVALSVDRCDAITNPMNFSRSRVRARALVCGAWMLSSVLAAPLLVLYHVRDVQGVPQCWIELGGQARWRAWVTGAAIALVALPAAAIAACYAVIVVTIWRHSRLATTAAAVNCKLTNNVADAACRRASSRGLIPRAKIKSVKMTFVIVFVFVVCWSPYIVFDLLQVWGVLGNSPRVLQAATLVQSLAPLNSAANPLICAAFSPHIAATLRRLPPCRWMCGRAKGGTTNGTRIRSRSDSTAHSDLITSSAKRTHTHHTRTSMNGSRDARTQLIALTDTGHAHCAAP